MSTTISTHQPHHLPLVASLVVAGVIAATGVVGVVWHESATSSSGHPAPALVAGAAAFRNAAVAERDQSGQSSPNARVAERNLQPDQGQGIGRGDFQSAGGGKIVGGP